MEFSIIYVLLKTKMENFQLFQQRWDKSYLLFLEKLG